MIVKCISDRFDQPGYKMYNKVEQLLLKASRQEDFASELKLVCSSYKDDFNTPLLSAHLEILVSDIQEYFVSLSCAQRAVLSQVTCLLQLIIIMSDTNSTTERLFSALHTVKSYHTTTMLQQRLNNLLILHIHKERTENLDIASVTSEFVQDSEHRLRIRGKFE